MERTGERHDAPPARARFRGDVLVALDGTARADVEFPVAATLARWMGADVRLVHVASSGWNQASLPTVGELDRMSRGGPCAPPTGRDSERLARAIARLQETSVVGVAVTVDWGEVTDRLSAIAARHGASAVVMRARPRHRWSRALLGSITTHVLRESPVPVVLVSASAPALGAGEHGAGAVGQRANVAADVGSRTVVVALDGTPHAERAAASVATLAESVGVRVLLAFLCARRSGGSRIRDAAARVAALQARLSRRGWAVSTEAVIAADEVEAIAVAAQDHGASVVAVTCGPRGVLAPHDTLRLCDRLGRVGGPPVWAVTERSPPSSED